MSTRKADTVPSKDEKTLQRFMVIHFWIVNAVSAVVGVAVAVIVGLHGFRYMAAINGCLAIVNVGFAVKLFSLRSRA